MKGLPREQHGLKRHVRPMVALRVMRLTVLAARALADAQEIAAQGPHDSGEFLGKQRSGCGNSCYYSVSIWLAFLGFWAVFWYCVVRSLFGPDAEKKDAAKD